MSMDLDITAKLISDRIKAGDLSAAAYWLMKLPDNGRRTIVRTITERGMSEEMLAIWGRYIHRLEADEELVTVTPVKEP